MFIKKKSYKYKFIFKNHFKHNLNIIIYNFFICYPLFISHLMLNLKAHLIYRLILNPRIHPLNFLHLNFVNYYPFSLIGFFSICNLIIFFIYYLFFIYKLLNF